MDETDLRIVRAILNDPLASVAHVARAARLGDSATRARIKRLKEEGTLGPVAAVPNARLFGKKYVVALYRGMDWRALFDIPQVIGSSVNHEGVVGPTCLVEEDLPPELLDRYGAPERTFVVFDEPLRPPGTALSDLQWRVMREFVADPTGTDRTLAKRAGLGARTVRRHRKAFVAGGHVRLEVQLRSLRGDHVLFHLYVQGPASHDRRVADALSSRLGGAWPQQYLETPRGVLFFCSAASLAEAAAAPQVARGLDGVEHAELVVSLDGAYRTERLVAACEAGPRTKRGEASLI